jgi:hypothetical protein
MLCWPLFLSYPIKEVQMSRRLGRNVACPLFVPKIAKLRQLWGTLIEISILEN